MRPWSWQKATDFGRRSLVKTAIGRYKSIIGDPVSTVIEGDGRASRLNGENVHHGGFIGQDVQVTGKMKSRSFR
jgi:hypothetical protein